MIKPGMKRTAMVLYVLAAFLLAGCGREELPEEEEGTIWESQEDILGKETPEREEKRQGAGL